MWFPEPARLDNSWAKRGEPTTDWLERSTNARARAIRRFLNENLSALPPEYQGFLYRMLHERWHSGFFELIVGRTLQILGADIEAEPGGASNTRIDYAAHFPDANATVEAVSPVFDSTVGETAKKRNPLLDIIESESPADIWVMVSTLPDIGPQDSKKRFRSTIRRLLATTGDIGSSPLEVSEELLEGTIRFTLVKKGATVPPGKSVGSEPPLTSFDNTEQRIRRAVARKRRQGRHSGDAPALVAIHATGISSSYEEFDQALFGRDVATVDSRGHLLSTEFKADGMFAEGSGEPTWAAVLAFLGVGFMGGPDPILYLHPRFEGKLPDALLALEERVYDPELGKFIVREPLRAGVLEGMGFVSRDI